MSKRNKLRYQSKGNQWPPLVLSGQIFLRWQDDEEMKTAQKGDLQIYITTDSISYNTNVGNYEATGFEGYLKAEIFDGKAWRLISLEEFFPGREHYFGKRERPWDTYIFCLPIFKAHAGRKMLRTYREHYVLAPEGAEEEAQQQ